MEKSAQAMVFVHQISLACVILDGLVRFVRSLSVPTTVQTKEDAKMEFVSVNLDSQELIVPELFASMTVQAKECVPMENVCVISDGVEMIVAHVSVPMLAVDMVFAKLVLAACVIQDSKEWIVQHFFAPIVVQIEGNATTEHVVVTTDGKVQIVPENSAPIDALVMVFVTLTQEFANVLETGVETIALLLDLTRIVLVQQNVQITVSSAVIHNLL
jgi:hypothetical protein